jgi:hypothetical protein
MIRLTKLTKLSKLTKLTNLIKLTNYTKHTGTTVAKEIKTTKHADRDLSHINPKAVDCRV